MKIHSALDAGGARVVKMATVTSWDRFQAQAIWGIPVYVVPGLTKPNSTCARTVDFMSIYPTLCELCELTTPSHVEGVSIKRLLADPQAAWDRPALTTHGFQNHAVRSERWRYIRYADGGEELYDEQADPLEWKNLAGDPQHAAVKKELSTWFPKQNVPQGPTGGKKAGAAKKKQKKAS